MKFNTELNPVLWDKDNDNQMRPEVIAKLKEIAEAFIEYLEIPQDAVLDKVVTGSSASYNYNEFSDLDLHIIVDYDKIHEDCPLVQGYLGALKNTFNKEHDITIHDIPVELYAEAKDQGTVHNGLYSVQEEEWIDRPKKIAPTDNDAAVEAKYYEIKDMVDKCDDSETATELLAKIYNMRKAGLAEAGEFCTENLAFKKLRNEGCMDKLRQIKKEQIDKQLSLESYNESLEQDVKELTKTDDYYKVDGSRVSIKNGFGSQVELMDLQNLGKKLEKKGYKVYCSNYYIDAQKNESIKEDTSMDKYKPMYDKATELAQDRAKIDFVSKMNPQDLVNYAIKAIKRNDADISDVENMLYKANYTPGQVEDIMDMIRTTLDESVNEEVDYVSLATEIIDKEGKDKIKQGLKTPYQKDYLWGLTHRQPGLDLTKLKDEVEKQLDESIGEESQLDKEAELAQKLIDTCEQMGFEVVQDRFDWIDLGNGIHIQVWTGSVTVVDYNTGDEKELPLETEENLQSILNQINELKKNESVDEEKEYENIVIFGAIPFINSKLRDANLFYITKPYTGKTRKYDGILVKVPEDDTAGFEMWLQEQKLKYADLEDLPKNESLEELDTFHNNIKTALGEEMEERIYNVEFNYEDEKPGLAIGTVKVKAASEQEALDKAEQYAKQKHPTYTEDSCKLADSGFDNDEIIESVEDDKFNYMMLSRLEQDCKYFLGYGNGSERNLWAGNVEDQIAEMRKIYDKLPEKPEWLSLEDIDRYEKDMLALKEQPMEEDLDTLEKKIDDVTVDVQDMLDKFQTREAFDFEKAYNTINEALKED